MAIYKIIEYGKDKYIPMQTHHNQHIQKKSTKFLKTTLGIDLRNSNSLNDFITNEITFCKIFANRKQSCFFDDDINLTK